MFLKALNQEEKSKFLAMVELLVSVDGDVSEQERLHVAAYAAEMGIDGQVAEAGTVSELTAFFSERPETTKKIVLAELTALAHIDGSFCSAEKSLLGDLESAFALPAGFADSLSSWISRISPLYAEGFKLVNLA